MKLVVVAAAALALVAGSVDVEAHCGECKGDKKSEARAKAPEGAEKAECKLDKSECKLDKPECKLDKPECKLDKSECKLDKSGGDKKSL